jgi:hypothetical protein
VTRQKLTSLAKRYGLDMRMVEMYGRKATGLYIEGHVIHIPGGIEVVSPKLLESYIEAIVPDYKVHKEISR